MDDNAIPQPPPDLHFVGGGDFAGIGRLFLDLFVEHGGLRPHHRALDVGCGVGRLAAPLTRYLNTSGSYEGFDIVDVGIDWCRREITSRFPNFRFQLADVFNRGYHPGGRHEACDYLFPFADCEFDFVFLTSVFTHMLPADMENYLAEVARVLKPEGRCVMTWFLRNAEAVHLTASGRSRVNFRHPGRGYWTTSPHVPEEAVCYDEGHVRELIAANGLELSRPALYGDWCGRDGGSFGHDVLIARKVRHVERSRPPRPWSARLAHGLRRLIPMALRQHRWRGALADAVARARGRSAA